MINIILLGVILSASVIVVFLLIAHYLDKKLAAQLEIEKQKPKFVVFFTTINNGHYRTKPFEPKVFIDEKITSEQFAIAHLKECYNRGYFEAYGMTIPLSQIVQAKVELY